MTSGYCKQDSSQELSPLIDNSERNLKDSNKQSQSQEKLEFCGKLKDFGLLTVVVLLQGVVVCSESFLYPFFPEEALKRGLTQTHIGIVFSAYELGRFITSGIAGSLVAKATPKTMLIIGGAVSSVCSFLLGLFYYVDDRLFFALNVITRLIAGCGMSIVAVSGLSLLLKATQFQTGTVLSVVEGTIGGAYVLGATAGIVLQSLVGYSGTCYIFGGFMATLMIIHIIVLPRIEDTIKYEKGFLPLVKDPGQILLFIHSFTTTLAKSSRLISLTYFLMTTFGASASDVGMVYIVAGLSYIPCAVFIGFLINKKLIYSLIIGCWLWYSLFLLTIGPSPLLGFIFHGKQYYLCTVISWSSQVISMAGLFQIPFKASLNLAEAKGFERDSIHTYGMIAGMVNCAQGLGSIAGPASVGVLYDVMGFPWLMTMFALIQFGLVAVTIAYLIGMRLAGFPLTPEQADQSKLSS